MIQNREIPSLDGLRFIAAFIVFVSHFSNATGLFGFVLGQGAGQVGVMLFFLLSAFLIGWLYLPFSFTIKRAGDFSRRRAARVLPLYFLIVLLFWFAYKLYGPESPISSVQDSNLFEHLFLVRGQSIFWTIPVEIHFYLVFMIIWWLYSYWPDAIILLLVTVIFFFAYVGEHGVLPNIQLALCIHYFVAGLLCAIYVLRHPNFLDQIWANRIFTLTFLSIPLLYPKISNYFSGNNSPVWASEYIMFVLVFLILSSVKSSISQLLLGNRIMRYLGNISYGIYLCHYPIIVIVGYYSIMREFIILYFFTSFFITIICSSILFFGLERPSRRFLSGRPI